ncbi:hypothetical protein BLA29_007236 [Euroglyphus maynei]|uniref:Uncharacterized protein n=1 Tax=Euroglyphus maynei TaxID=6958 RepID=A0A1Y3BN96_EURMA|nr:hypothetical protein BLA29_007236 [Euroglyphus maynei]
MNDPDDNGWTILIGIFIFLCVLIPEKFGRIQSKTLLFKSSDTFSNLPTLSSSSSSASLLKSMATNQPKIKLIQEYHPFIKHENYRKSLPTTATTIQSSKRSSSTKTSPIKKWAKLYYFNIK